MGETFVVGRTYSRQEINAALGGSLRSYLPTREGRVVCGCFKRVPKYSPDAPQVVTFGDHDKVQEVARLVWQQGDPIPVFVFRSACEWEYRGRYRCTDLSTEPDVLEREMAANPARGTIAGVLYFERVGG
jgi:hypothetical protein